MPEGCLQGVQGVSGGCVSDSGYCLGGMICKQLINIQLESSSSAYSFSPSCRGLVKMCYILGCLKGVWKVSEDV